MRLWFPTLYLTLRNASSQAYYLRDEDTWTKIDYKSQAHAWMKPLRRGKATGLVEIPANWYLDDLPPMMYVLVREIDLIPAHPEQQVHQVQS